MKTNYSEKIIYLLNKYKLVLISMSVIIFTLFASLFLHYVLVNVGFNYFSDNFNRGNVAGAWGDTSTYFQVVREGFSGMPAPASYYTFIEYQKIAIGMFAMAIVFGAPLVLYSLYVLYSGIKNYLPVRNKK